jgi:hypothetical protein
VNSSSGSARTLPIEGFGGGTAETLSQVPDAIRYLAAGQARGKVVITV